MWPTTCVNAAMQLAAWVWVSRGFLFSIQVVVGLGDPWERRAAVGEGIGRIALLLGAVDNTYLTE